jgi:hypothetical protein
VTGAIYQNPFIQKHWLPIRLKLGLLQSVIAREQKCKKKPRRRIGGSKTKSPIATAHTRVFWSVCNMHGRMIFCRSKSCPIAGRRPLGSSFCLLLLRLLQPIQFRVTPHASIAETNWPMQVESSMVQFRGLVWTGEWVDKRRPSFPFRSFLSTVYRPFLPNFRLSISDSQFSFDDTVIVSLLFTHDSSTLCQKRLIRVDR